MAKARPIKGLSPDMRFGDAAARTVRVRAQELIDHSEGVLDTSSIQRVHAMRVASRRLRAVLEIHRACFPPELFKPVLREVKGLADALGARRDPDVQLASIEEFAAALGPGEQAGIALFADRLRAEQEEGNRVLADALERMRHSDLPARLQELADSATTPEPAVEDVSAEAPESPAAESVDVSAEVPGVPVAGPADASAEVPDVPAAEPANVSAEVPDAPATGPPEGRPALWDLPAQPAAGPAATPLGERPPRPPRPPRPAPARPDADPATGTDLAPAPTRTGLLRVLRRSR